MVSSDAKQRMIRRVAREIEAGMTVNLGIGLPTRVIDHVDHDLSFACIPKTVSPGSAPASPMTRPTAT